MSWDWTVAQYAAYILGSVAFAVGSVIGLLKYLNP